MRLILGILSSTSTKRSSGHSTGIKFHTPTKSSHHQVTHTTLHQDASPGPRTTFPELSNCDGNKFLEFSSKTMIEIAKNNKDSTLGRSTEMRVRVLSCPLPLRWVGPFFRPVRFILRQEAKEGPVDTYFNNRLLMTSNTPPRFL